MIKVFSCLVFSVLPYSRTFSTNKVIEYQELLRTLQYSSAVPAIWQRSDPYNFDHESNLVSFLSPDFKVDSFKNIRIRKNTEGYEQLRELPVVRMT